MRHTSSNLTFALFSQSSSENLLCRLLPTTELKELCQNVTYMRKEQLVEPFEIASHSTGKQTILPSKH